MDAEGNQILPDFPVLAFPSLVDLIWSIKVNMDANGSLVWTHTSNGNISASSYYAQLVDNHGMKDWINLITHTFSAFPFFICWCFFIIGF